MISIRRAHPDEADILSQIAFSAKSHWGYPARWMEIWKPQLTFSPDYFKANEGWVAVVENIPIGFYVLRDKARIAWLEDLWVLPAHMGAGVGGQLFVHAMDRARELGYEILQLDADPNALGFYEKMGMRKIGERHSEVDGQPRILPIMETGL
jgi:GNAT superfamily N-acetyltransferase